MQADDVGVRKIDSANRSRRHMATARHRDWTGSGHEAEVGAWLGHTDAHTQVTVRPGRKYWHVVLPPILRALEVYHS